MKAQEIMDYLNRLDGGWVNRENTVDTFKSGDPEAEVTGIAVGWMSYTGALQRAEELNCNVFVTHEPTYFNHLDDLTEMQRYPGVAAKKRMIEESGIAILRCHDLWDQVRGIGIPDSWGQQLDFSNPVDGDGYYRAYDLPETTALDVAKRMAARLQPLGQEAVQLIGPEDAVVRRVVIGTGAATPFLRMLEKFNADLVVCSDDGIVYWRDAAFAIDMNIPIVVVNHAVSEVNGMKLLADHLAAGFPNVPVHYIPQSCMYRLVSP